MKSMTGYGSAQESSEALQLTVEVKSYNNRFLDLTFNLPSYLGSLEPRLREYVAPRVARGKIDVSVRITEWQEQSEMVLDVALAQSYIRGLEQLREIAESEEPVGLDQLSRMEGVFKAREARDPETYAAMVEDVLARAFESFEGSRVREGDHTRTDVVLQLGGLRKEVERVAQAAPEIRRTVVANLRERFVELLGEGAEESRIMAEAALLLVKLDVNEEIQRMRSHMSAFEKIVEAGGSCGKKLDFICQELNREANTLGSKNMLLEIDDAIITMKDRIEKIREQLRNVE